MTVEWSIEVGEDDLDVIVETELENGEPADRWYPGSPDTGWITTAEIKVNGKWRELTEEEYEILQQDEEGIVEQAWRLLARD